MELSFAQQTQAFFLSVLLGVFLAAGYGVVKFFRCAFSLGKAATVALDILFMLCWAASVFFFSLAYLMGYIRIYVFFGSALGFTAYRCTVGKLFYKIYSPIIKCFKVIFHKFCIKSKLIAKKLLKIAYKILYNISSKKERLKKRHFKSVKGKKYEYIKTKKKTSRRHGGRNRGNRKQSPQNETRASCRQGGKN